MSLFSSIFGTRKIERTESEELVITHIENSVTFFNVDSNSLGFHFEAAIISTYYMLQLIRQNSPQKYDKVQILAHNYLSELGGKVSNKINMPLPAFVNSRFQLCANELDIIIQRNEWNICPEKTLYNLYERPLSSGSSLNMFNDMNFKNSLKHFLDFSIGGLPMLVQII